MLSLTSSDPHFPIATTSVAETLAESSNTTTSVQTRLLKLMAAKGLSNTDDVICVAATCSVRATLQRQFPSLVYA